MILKIMSFLFGCSHKHTTFPMKRELKKHPTVTCLDCGQEFDYNWLEMRICGKK